MFRTTQEKARAELAEVKAATARSAEYRKQASIAYFAAEAMLTAAEGDEELCKRIEQFSTMARNLMEAHFEVAQTGRRDIKEIEADIEYIESFVGFIDADYDFDRLSYALSSASMKYKAKLFRAAMRKLKEVEGRREELRASKAMLKPLLAFYTEPILKSLDTAYAVVSPAMRALKKRVAAEGATALASWTAPDGVDAKTLKNFLNIIAQRRNG